MINTNTGLQPVTIVDDTPKGREFHDKGQTNGHIRPPTERNTGRGRNTNGRGITITSGRDAGRGRNPNGRGTAGRGCRSTPELLRQMKKNTGLTGLEPTSTKKISTYDDTTKNDRLANGQQEKSAEKMVHMTQMRRKTRDTKMTNGQRSEHMTEMRKKTRAMKMVNGQLPKTKMEKKPEE